MDPTLLVCRRKISLLEPDLELMETDLPDPLYRKNFDEDFDERVTLNDVVLNDFNENEQPLTNIGQTLLDLSPLAINESIVAANIDAIFKFTGHVLGILNPQTPDRFSEYTFIDLFGAPGGFTEYLQWRRPHSYGFGLGSTSNSRREVTDWNTARLNLHEFRPYEYSSDLTLFENYELFLSRIGNRDIDLIYGLSNDPSLLLFEIVTSLKLVKEGGNIIIKLPRSSTLSDDLIYLISTCFEAIALFNPLSSNDIYLIGWNESGRNRNRVLRILIPSLKEEIDVRQINTLVRGDLPEEFENWLERRYDNLNIEVFEVLDESEYNIPKILTVWGIPIRSAGADKVGETDDRISARIGTMYRNLVKLDPIYLNEFFFNTTTRLSPIDEAIYSLSVRTGMDESAIRTRIDAIPRQTDLDIDKTEILTSITTSRGFKLTMKTNRFEFLTDGLQTPGEEMANLIDRYSFFGMECIKFEFKDSLNHLTEAISSPLTNTLSNYYSLYPEDSIFGSKGTFEDMINSELDNLIFVLPLSVKLMDTLYDKLKDTGTDTRELYFIAPYWPDHPLIKWMIEKGKTILSTREQVFTRLDFSKVRNPTDKVIIGYMGKSYDTPLLRL